jgi:hypothetical protein
MIQLEWLGSMIILRRDLASPLKAITVKIVAAYVCAS